MEIGFLFSLATQRSPGFVAKATAGGCRQQQAAAGKQGNSRRLQATAGGCRQQQAAT